MKNNLKKFKISFERMKSIKAGIDTSNRITYTRDGEFQFDDYDNINKSLTDQDLYVSHDGEFHWNSNGK